jgi:hypothetical protein
MDMAELSMTFQHDKPKWWRPLRFSLLALLLLMLVVASYFGGRMSNEWRRQRELDRARQETEPDLLMDLMYDMPVPDISETSEPEQELRIRDQRP